jgi:hypothetical protein
VDTLTATLSCTNNPRNQMPFSLLQALLQWQ